MNQIMIQGSQVHYWVFNPKKQKVIVMIHGFRGTHHGLQNIIDRLNDYKIIIPDLPGFGASTPFTIAHSLDAYTNFIAQFLQAVAPKKPILLGHSFGAILASHFAAQHPQTISKLIIMNAIATPVLKGPSKLATQFAVGYYWAAKKLPERSARALLGNKGIVMLASIFMTKTKDKALRRKIHASHLQHFSTFHNTTTLNEVFKTSISHTAADKAELISVPTLIIAGAVDEIAPLQGQYVLREKIPQAKLLIIPSVGHLTQHEAPTEVAKAIRAFLT